MQVLFHVYFYLITFYSMLKFKYCFHLKVLPLKLYKMHLACATIVNLKLSAY